MISWEISKLALEKVRVHVLYSFENDILKNLETGIKFLAVFVDLEKAPHTQGLGLKCSILNFIKNFLLNRTFQMKIGLKMKSQTNSC